VPHAIISLRTLQHLAALLQAKTGMEMMMMMMMQWLLSWAKKPYRATEQTIRRHLKSTGCVGGGTRYDEQSSLCTS